MSSGAISLCPSFPACLPGAAINTKLQLEQAALLMQRPLCADAHPMKKSSAVTLWKGENVMRIDFCAPAAIV